jgi:Zn ribbon nucleic-acid-binding protein
MAMRGLTSSLWPIRYKPLSNELLSCWLVRLAHGHGLKVQTFCNLIFGNRLQVWNRDIDRLAPSWLLDELCLRTGTPDGVARRTTIRQYEGVLYRRFRLTGVLDWILVQKMYHRKRQGFGLQFCPLCLAEDETPYFRTQWRLALNTLCVRHEVMLMDRCPACQAVVAAHRLDMAKHDAIHVPPLSYCHVCGYDFRDAPATKPIQYDRDVLTLLFDIGRLFDGQKVFPENWQLAHFEVMRHLCFLMTSRYEHIHLRDFVSKRLGIGNVLLKDGRVPFESRSVHERHCLMQLTCWLLVDLQERLTEAWRAGAVRYNVLLKDFDAPPDFYVRMVREFSNWRDRFDANDMF